MSSKSSHHPQPSWLTESLHWFALFTHNVSSAADFNTAWRGVTEAQHTRLAQAEPKNLVLNRGEQPSSGQVVRF